MLLMLQCQKLFLMLLPSNRPRNSKSTIVNILGFEEGPIDLRKYLPRVGRSVGVVKCARTLNCFARTPKRVET